MGVRNLHIFNHDRMYLANLFLSPIGDFIHASKYSKIYIFSQIVTKLKNLIKTEAWNLILSLNNSDMVPQTPFEMGFFRYNSKTTSPKEMKFYVHSFEDSRNRFLLTFI